MSIPASPNIHVRISFLVSEALAVQGIGTMAMLAIAALAPEVARALHVSTSIIGYQVALVYFAAAVGSLVAGRMVSFFGPCRTSQIAMVLTATGCLFESIANLGAIVIGSLFIGVAYGLINPAASELLNRHSPPHRRNLIFSLKQTGVPIGGMSAGLLGPPLALSVGWQALPLLIAGAAICVALISERGRAALDGDRRGVIPHIPFLYSMKTLAKSRQLLWLSLSSFCFSGVQLCIISFLVALLVEELGFDLVTAGIFLAATQVSGAFGRVFWGAVADKFKNGLSVLMGIALITAVASVIMLFAVPEWPYYLALPVYLMLGFTAVGWNGVYLSEVARQSGTLPVSATTGAAMFFTFAGVVVGPSTLSLLHGFWGSYIQSYGFLVVVSLLGGVLVAISRPRSETSL
jgi:predicted MFS family arabinose efflux permease